MKHMGLLVLLVSICMCAQLQGCGGGGDTALTITITDAKNTVVARTGTAGVYPTSFNIAFSVPMDATTVTTLGNVTFTCNIPDTSVTQPAIVVAAHATEANTYTATITNAYRCALLDSTLMLTSNVKDANNNAIPETFYTFTNAAALSDDFNADSSAYWTLFPDLYADWNEMFTSGFAAFDTANSSLDIEFQGDVDQGVMIYKSVTVVADQSLELYVPSMANFIDEDSYVKINLFDVISDPKDSTKFISLGVDGADMGTGIGRCQIAARSTAVSPTFLSAYRAPCLIANGGYYVRFSKSGDTFEMQYKAEGDTDFSPMELDPSTQPMADIGLEGSLYLALASESSDLGGAEQFSVGYMSTTGITADGMFSD